MMRLNLVFKKIAKTYYNLSCLNGDLTKFVQSNSQFPFLSN